MDNQYIVELKEKIESKGCCLEFAPMLESLLKGEKIDYVFDLIDTIAARSLLNKKKTLKEANLGISKNGLAGVALRLINESAK
jgi:hypothetical protein